MNNYFKNQIRRANCTLPKKAILFLLGVLRPDVLRRLWADHVADMQKQLDERGRYYDAPYLDLHPRLGQSSLVR
ncbi:MAG: hypothetical protein J6Y20_04800 [Lachnospiraceae bacterium]|nr:hypothetical protein [Kiritimatiellia bacterium]MBP5461425.1 hypothetical protein [Lachnospiraceae bacterium]